MKKTNKVESTDTKIELAPLPENKMLKIYYSKPEQNGMVCYVGEATKNYTTTNGNNMVEVFLCYADGTRALYNFRRENIRHFQPK